jgi:hypothetical protein
VVQRTWQNEQQLFTSASQEDADKDVASVPLDAGSADDDTAAVAAAPIFNKSRLLYLIRFTYQAL